MVRNKYFKPTKYIPRGNPDKIDVALVGDANSATQRVINGQADYSNGAIPPDRIANAKSKGHLVLRDDGEHVLLLDEHRRRRRSTS